MHWQKCVTFYLRLLHSKSAKISPGLYHLINGAVSLLEPLHHGWMVWFLLLNHQPSVYPINFILAWHYWQIWFSRLQIEEFILRTSLFFRQERQSLLETRSIWRRQSIFQAHIKTRLAFREKERSLPSQSINILRASFWGKEAWGLSFFTKGIQLLLAYI